jgi:mono/diheme cytochrome c family protein
MNRRQSMLMAPMLVAVWCLTIAATAFTQSPLQSSGPRAASESDAVKRGEAWFYQRCSLCHMGRIVKDDTYESMAPSLEGILKDAPSDREELVRETIQRGSRLMPGFRYNFTPTEFEELIVYLKTL